jgi:hypothetical protein
MPMKAVLSPTASPTPITNPVAIPTPSSIDMNTIKSELSMNVQDDIASSEVSTVEEASLFEKLNQTEKFVVKYYLYLSKMLIFIDNNSINIYNLMIKQLNKFLIIFFSILYFIFYIKSLYLQSYRLSYWACSC